MAQSAKERGSGLLEYYQCSRDKERREGRVDVPRKRAGDLSGPPAYEVPIMGNRPQNQGLLWLKNSFSVKVLVLL
jgi:hypothetical protein